MLAALYLYAYDRLRPLKTRAAEGEMEPETNETVGAPILVLSMGEREG